MKDLLAKLEERRLGECGEVECPECGYSFDTQMGEGNVTESMSDDRVADMAVAKVRNTLLNYSAIKHEDPKLKGVLSKLDGAIEKAMKRALKDLARG